MQNFDCQRDALAAADAECDKAAREAVPAHRVDEFRGEHRARCTDRVAMRNGAAFDIDDVVGQSELAGYHDRDRRERLIDLSALNRADVPAGALQRLLHCRDWSKAEHAGLDRRDAVGDEARRRGEAVLLSPGLVREHHRAAASFSPGALPAVIVPFDRKAGFSRASASSVVSGRLRLVLVELGRSLLAGHFDGHDLRLEMAGRLRGWRSAAATAMPSGPAPRG